MLTTVAIVLIVLWALGMIGGYFGGLIHVLLLVAIVVVGIRLVAGRRVV